MSVRNEHGARRETARLRRLIERPERCRFWGQEYTITPRLIARVFGDGQKLMCVTPLATRPNYYAVRVDSTTTDPRDPFGDSQYPLIDDIASAAEEEYGYFGDEEERDASGNDPRPFPVTDWGIGVAWGEPFPISEWKPTRPRKASAP